MTSKKDELRSTEEKVGYEGPPTKTMAAPKAILKRSSRSNHKAVLEGSIDGAITQTFNATPQSIEESFNLREAQERDAQEEAEMASLTYALRAAPAIRAGALSLTDGSVVGFQGEFDAETTCAVAAMTKTILEDVGALLGVGEVKSWCISSPSRSTLYVSSAGGNLVVAVGEDAKNPNINLQKLHQASNQE